MYKYNRLTALEWTDNHWSWRESNLINIVKFGYSILSCNWQPEPYNRSLFVNWDINTATIVKVNTATLFSTSFWSWKLQQCVNRTKGTNNNFFPNPQDKNSRIKLETKVQQCICCMDLNHTCSQHGWYNVSILPCSWGRLTQKVREMIHWFSGRWWFNTPYSRGWYHVI